MANRIELRGVIVGAGYDSDDFSSYIDKGLITPESRVRSAISKADPSKPLDVYINSPGGSVFAGNEMANAIRDWKRTTGQKVNVTIGAMAASMASFIPLQIADHVAAHANSKLMFHGASSISIGGEGAMKDTAELLGKMNADTKTALVTRYNLNPDEVSQWFAEGREKWMTADEAKKAGIVNEVLGEAAAPVKFSSQAVKDFAAKGIGITQLAGAIEIEAEQSTTTEANNEQNSGNAGQSATPPPPASGGPASQQPPANASHDEQLAIRENRIIELKGQIEAIRAELSTANQSVARLSNDLTAEQAAHEGTRSSLAILKARHEKMFKGAHYQPEAVAEKTWPELVKQHGYAKARALFPDLYKQTLKPKK